MWSYIFRPLLLCSILTSLVTLDRWLCIPRSTTPALILPHHTSPAVILHVCGGLHLYMLWLPPAQHSPAPYSSSINWFDFCLVTLPCSNLRLNIWASMSTISNLLLSPTIFRTICDFKCLHPTLPSQSPSDKPSLPGFMRDLVPRLLHTAVSSPILLYVASGIICLK